MKWIKERDDLIAQTKAFVQSVAGRKPQATNEPVLAGPESIEKSMAVALPEPPLMSLPIDHATVTPAPPPISTAIEQPFVVALHQGEVRKEIQNRVAAFKAHQHRFHQEREAYFNAVLTKARSGSEAGPDQL